MKSCVYPGSFDPVTSGHLDIIRRAAAVFDRVTVTVMINISKKCAIPAEERVRLLEKCCAGLPDVRVDSWNGLLVDYMKSRGETVVIRGARSASDFAAERQSHEVNRLLMPGMETVQLFSRPELSMVSSSAVREAAHFGADLSALVPGEILRDVTRLLKSGCV